MTGFLAGFSAAGFMEERGDGGHQGPISDQELKASTPRNVLSSNASFGIVYQNIPYHGIL
jgi:hypothetical protein